MTEASLLAIDALSVRIRTSKTRTVEILNGVSLTLDRGEMHGLVGETGSGKSMTARAVIGLLPDGGEVTSGQIRLDGRDLVALSERELQQVHGRVIGMIFQNPRTALHPMLSVQTQMENVLKAHMDLSKRERVDRIVDHLRLVGMSDPDRVARSYPHELSGGMAQRAVIATALLCDPRILLADEPSTGLDATIQRQILDLLADLQQKLNLSILMITHDLGIVAQYCDRISVMYEGTIAEHGNAGDVLRNPQAPYTQRLLGASRLDLRDRPLEVAG